MTLDDALRETGCATFTDNLCVTTVERLSDGAYLLMTRRGVCILQCRFASMDEITRQYGWQAVWQPGKIAVIPQVPYTRYAESW